MLAALAAAWLPAGATRARADSDDGHSFVEWLASREQASTTDLRREYKTTVTAKAADRFLRAVADQVGQPSPREDGRPGSLNLNDTDYLDTGDALWDVLGYRQRPPEGSISPKIRIRQYVERDAAGDHKAIITKGQSFLELKIPHPTLAGVSLKPRLIVNNRQLAIFLERDRLSDPRDRAQLAANLKADSRNDPEVVDRFLSVFDALHAVHEGDTLRPWLTTRYVRQAYLVPVRDGAGRPYDLQITVDREVEYHKPGGRRIGSYKPRWRAVEVKVPVELAELPDAELQARGLAGVVALRSLQATYLEPSRRGSIRGGKAGAFKVVLSDGREQRLKQARFRTARGGRARRR